MSECQYIRALSICILYIYLLYVSSVSYIHILFLIKGIVSKWKNNGYLLDKECFKSKKGSNAH